MAETDDGNPLALPQSAGELWTLTTSPSPGSRKWVDFGLNLEPLLLIAV
jgi:hypothetical protein